MNNRMWSVIQQEIANNLHRRAYLVTAFGIPLLAIAIVLAITFFQANRPEGSEEPLPARSIGYVDESGLFADPGPFAGVLVAYDSQTAARTDVEAGQISGYYLIPKDYLATGEVTRYARQINVAEGDLGLFQTFLQNTLAAGRDPWLPARLQSPASVVEHQLDASGAEVTSRQSGGLGLFWLVYVFTLLMMLTTFMTASQLMQSVVAEKENRTVEIVLSSLKPFQLMTGKIIGQGLMGLLLVFTWLGTLLLLINLVDSDAPLLAFLRAAELPANLALVIIPYYLLGFTLYGAFAAAIGAISVNLREGPQYAMIYSIPAVLPVMFLATIVESPNSTLAVALSFFPLSAPIGMIERMVSTAVPAWQVGLSLIILALSVVAGLWLAARLFRVNNLLSGRLPTRKELVQLLVRG